MQRCDRPSRVGLSVGGRQGKAVALTVALLGAGCSLSTDWQKEVKVVFEVESRDARLVRASEHLLLTQGIPTAVDQFDCYAVNVTGEGITPASYSSDTSCTDLGVTSNLVPASTGGTLELEVAPGPARKIQLIGIQSAVGCPAGTLSDLLLTSAASFSGVYELGTSTQDLYQDASVDIRSTFDASSPAPALACVAPPPPTLTAISPKIGPIAGGTVVTLTGYGFRKDIKIDLSGKECAPLTLSGTTLATCTTPSVTAAGAYDVVGLHRDSVRRAGVKAFSKAFTYYAPLEISPTASTLLVSESVTFKASGGIEPYAYSVVEGGGSVASTGVYAAPSTAGSARVRVSDTASQLASAAITINPPPYPTSFTLAGGSLRAAACSDAFTITALDSAGAAYGSSLPFSVSLSVGGAASGFYSDSGCATAGTSVAFAAGTKTGLFYLRPTAAGTVSVTAASGSITAGVLSVAVGAGSPASFTLSGASSASVATCSGALTLGLLDSLGNSAAANGILSISLSGTGSAMAFTDSACAGFASTMVLSSGASSGVFYVKDTAAESVTLTASVSGMTSASRVFTFNAGSGSSLSLSNAYPTGTAGACLGPYTVSRRDSFGNSAPATTSSVINLSGGGSTVFSTGSSCASSEPSLTISAGGSALGFYLKDTAAGVLTVSASEAGLTSAATAITLSAGALSRLSITGTQSITTGNCSAFTASQSDAYGNSILGGSATSVTMSGAASGALYPSYSCTGAVSVFSIAAGSSSQAFYVRDTLAESLTLSAASGSLTSGTYSVTVSAGSASSLTILPGASSGSAGACSSAFTVIQRDAYGNAATLGYTLNVTLSGGSYGGFYSNSACSVTTWGASIGSGNSYSTFYFKDTAAESLTLTASSNVGYPTTTYSVTAATASVASLFGTQSITTGVCSSFSASRVDTYGNYVYGSSAAAVSLSGGSFGSTYSDAGCTSAADSVTISSGSSTQTLYFKDTRAETITLSAEIASVGTGTRAVTVNPGVPGQLQLLAAPSSVTAGSCSSAFTLQQRDSYGNLATTGSTTWVTLSGASYGSYYSDSGCTSGTTIAAITSGLTETSYYYRDTRAEFLTLVASTSYASVTNAIWSNPGGPVSLAFSTPGSSTNAGTCYGSFNVTRVDSYNNAANTGGALAVTLSPSGSAGAFSDSGCTAQVTSPTIASGTTQVTFYTKDTYAETFTLTAAASGFSNITTTVSVSAAAASVISLEGDQSRLRSTCSNSYTVRTRDSYGNASNLGATTAISLAGVGNGSFYSDASCAGPTSAVSIPAGLAWADGFYFMDTSAENVTMTASASGMTAGALVTTIYDSLAMSPAQWTLAVSNSKSFTVTGGYGSISYGISTGPGTMNSSTGLYTASISTGVSYLNAVDSDGNYAYATTTVNPALAASPTQRKVDRMDSITISGSGGAPPYSFSLVSGTGTVDSNGVYYAPTFPRYLAIGSVDLVRVTDNVGNTSDSTLVVYGRQPKLMAAEDGSSGTPPKGWSCYKSQSSPLKCWGDGSFGRHGLGDNEIRGDQLNEMGVNLAAVNLSGGAGEVRAVSGMEYQTCVIQGSGQLRCWGKNLYGELGYGDTFTRGETIGTMGNGLPGVDLSTNVVQVAVGAENTCVILDDDGIKCWGRNNNGALGKGDIIPRGDGPGEMGLALGYVELGANRTAKYLATGQSFAAGPFTCAILDTLEVKCWGTNDKGQLGQGDIITRGNQAGQMGSYLPTVNLGTGRGAYQLALSQSTACAVLDTLDVKCWGEGARQGLGDNFTRGVGPWQMGDNLPIVNLGTGRKAKWLGPTMKGTCAILDDLTLKCWGDGSRGILGHGAQTVLGDGPNEMGDNLPTVNLGTGRYAREIQGSYHVCATLDTGEVKCWGKNTEGGLGLGDNLDRGDTPYEMGDNLPIIQL